MKKSPTGAKMVKAEVTTLGNPPITITGLTFDGLLLLASDIISRVLYESLISARYRQAR